MTPNAAMKTVPPKAPRPYVYMGQLRKETPRRPTDLMVHIEGHGPRRIYRSDFTRNYFYILGKRRVNVDPLEILRILAKR